MLRLYNTLTRKKEEFKPINPSSVGMYTCGPTVYDFVHIGNLRAYVFYDILKRALLQNGYKVKHVMNITDVDDKIIKKSAIGKTLDAKRSIQNFTKQYTEAFFQDIAALNIIPADFYPKATEYIPAMVKLIGQLLRKGVAYKAEDGSVYFSIKKFPNYGKLSRVSKRQLKAGARVTADEYTKDSVQDFALWKAEKQGEPYWDAPFGRGRPGWHIECSAMSLELLGETLDLHSGGTDLIFPHHENEIAQSEAATGKQFVRYWVHNEHLLVDGAKMSKSLHNFYTLKDVEERGFDPLALRYLYLTAHYRDQLNFTWEALKGAQNALSKIKNQILNIKNTHQKSKIKIPRNIFLEEFTESINDDLNTSRALAVLWDVLKSKLPEGAKRKLLFEFDNVLGLGLGKITNYKLQITKEVRELVKKREEMRKAGKWQEADLLRKKIEKMSFSLEDTENGTIVKKK